MSLDKSFASFLKEDNTNPTIPSSGNVVTGLNSKEQTHALEVINGSLSAITDSPALNPYYLVERVKDRLKVMLGVSFDNIFFLGDVGSFEKPLVPHNSLVSVEGGTIPPNDNAWLKLFPHGLAIKFQFVKSGTLYNVNAEIVARPDPPILLPLSED